jgi:hypothetical protein
MDGREFANRAVAHMRAKPREHYPVCDPAGDQLARKLYQEWRAYFAWAGFTPRMFAALSGGFDRPRNGFTVPTEFPGDFDVTYVADERQSAGG